jgi:hypothetical protein
MSNPTDHNPGTYDRGSGYDPSGHDPSGHDPSGSDPGGYGPADPGNGGTRALIAFALAGSAVALTLGVYGGLHEPTGLAVNVAGFSGPMEAKAWLATLAALLAVAQLGSALAMYDRLPVVRVTEPPVWLGTMHRWSGRLAFLATVPVAMHCLYALGFQTYDTRTLVHSLLGCVFFGVFTVKMLALTREELPGWVLPVLGGTVFAGLVGLWLTSALWFFGTVGVRF